MTSERFQELLERLLDDDLSPPERMELLEAVAADRELAAKLYPMLWIEPWLADCLNTDDEAFVHRMQHEMAHGDDGEEFVCRVMAEYQRRNTAAASPSGNGFKGRYRRRKFWLGAVCAASLVVIGVAIAFLARPGQDGPGQDLAGKDRPRQINDSGPHALAARLESLQGDVTIVGLAGNHIAAQLDQVLFPGQQIQTGDEGSFATLRYADGTRLELNAATRLELVPAAGARGGKHLKLIGGLLDAEVAPQADASPMIISTPQAEIRVVGTKFLSSVSEQFTRIEMQRGQVQVQNHRGGRSIDVSAGQVAVVERQVEAIETKPLPPMLVKPKVVLPDPEGPVLSIDYSPDGKTLAVGGWQGTLTLWDLTTGKARHTIAAHSQGGIVSLAFSPDGQTVATLCYGDTSAKLWDVTTGKCRRTLSRPASEKKHLAAPQKLAFANDGSLLIVGAAQAIYLWDPKQGREVAAIPQTDNNLCTLAFSPATKVLATGHLDGMVRLWDIDDRKLLGTLPAHRKRVTCVAFSADGTTLASGSDDRTVKLWDLKTRTVRRTIEANLRPVRSVGFSGDGTYLAIGCSERMVRLWETRSGREAQLFEGTNYAYPDVKFSPDGKMLATAGWNKKVELWRLPGK
ncbi:MAG: FecR domain-containing protein [Thermoguttaceae bacterium]|jgi:ferric-dicitrate binding protein FerR (iron transport regulator)